MEAYVQNAVSAAGKILPVWVIVADEREARFYLKAGKELKLLSDVFPSPGAATVDAGRTGKHAYDLTEGQRRHDQLEFVNEVVKLLERASQQGDFGSFILIAPPKTLGELRKGLTPALQKILTASVAKDLMSYDQRRLSDALPDLLESAQ